MKIVRLSHSNLGKPVVIRQRSQEYWECPHCGKEILEKSTYSLPSDGSKDIAKAIRNGVPLDEFHRECQGKIIPPPPDPETQKFIEQLKNAPKTASGINPIMFCHGYCAEFAYALNESTGWQIITFNEVQTLTDDEEEEPFESMVHTACRHPSGKVADARGLRSEEQVRAKLTGEDGNVVPEERVRVQNVTPADVEAMYFLDNDALDMARQYIANNPSLWNLHRTQNKPDNTDAIRRNRQAVREMTLRTAQEKGIQITPAGDLVLFHGTSPKNARLINATKRLNSGTYFASDEQTAKRFAGQATARGTPVVMKVTVDPSAVFAGSYWSLNEAVYLGDDGVWRPQQ